MTVQNLSLFTFKITGIGPVYGWTEETKFESDGSRYLGDEEFTAYRRVVSETVELAEAFLIGEYEDSFSMKNIKITLEENIDPIQVFYRIPNHRVVKLYRCEIRYPELIGGKLITTVTVIAPSPTLATLMARNMFDTEHELVIQIVETDDKIPIDLIWTLGGKY